MNHVKQKGFTLIELMLAMTFIAILLIAIAMTTIQISNIYNKGITLREVNQGGRTLSDEFQRGVANSVPFDVTPKVDDSPATATSKYVVRDGGGRLCLGSYSYAWNYGKALAGGAGAPAVYNKYNDGGNVRFAKVRDPGGGLCSAPTSLIVRNDATDLLTVGDRDLVVHKLTVTKTVEDSGAGQSLYAISFVLGTNDRAQLTTNDASCRPPAENVGDEDYCSVNQFDIIARAGNAAGGN
jgi:prepilin-type N-terminal cleavage/methylation domain-containing protein